MGKKLPQNQLELYKRVDEILFYQWDPIGISDTTCPRDEYHSYLPQVFKRLLANETPEKLAEYLTHITTHSMGMSSNRDHDLSIAKHLLVIKEQCLD